MSSHAPKLAFKLTNHYRTASRRKALGASWLVQVYVRGLPFEQRRAWHPLSFLSAVKK